LVSLSYQNESWLKNLVKYDELWLKNSIYLEFMTEIAITVSRNY